MGGLCWRCCEYGLGSQAGYVHSKPYHLHAWTGELIFLCLSVLICKLDPPPALLKQQTHLAFVVLLVHVPLGTSRPNRCPRVVSTTLGFRRID